jgi:hypothetical protein
MERIKGIVVPAEWDSNGNVISLSIATVNKQEYLIEKHRHNPLTAAIRDKSVNKQEMQRTP